MYLNIKKILKSKLLYVTAFSTLLTGSALADAVTVVS